MGFKYPYGKDRFQLSESRSSFISVHINMDNGHTEGCSQDDRQEGYEDPYQFVLFHWDGLSVYKSLILKQDCSLDQ